MIHLQSGAEGQQLHLHHAVVTVSFLGLIRSGTGLAVLMIYFYREYNLLAEMMYNCKLPRAMLRTVLVFGLLSDSVNKGSVLYWVFVANIVLSSILNAIKSYTIIRHKSNPPLLIQITNMFKQQNFSYNSYLSLVYKARLRDIEMSVSLIASFMNIFSS